MMARRLAKREVLNDLKHPIDKSHINELLDVLGELLKGSSVIIVTKDNGDEYYLIIPPKKSQQAGFY